MGPFNIYSFIYLDNVETFSTVFLQAEPNEALQHDLTSFPQVFPASATPLFHAIHAKVHFLLTIATAATDFLPLDSASTVSVPLLGTFGSALATKLIVQ